MPRRSIGLIDMPCCYHVTQRCQERRFLLRFKKDRRQYLQRLREAVAKYPVSVLDYMVTSNHVHLLLWAERAAHVSATMRYLSGAAAQDYNRRKGREGAFWRGRFRPTLVETGTHLSRCLFYIEMNMVRAGAGSVSVNKRRCGMRAFATTVCGVWLLALPGFAGVQEGIEAMHRGDFETARREFTALAEQGDTRAMITLGRFYDRGEGVPEDNPKAFEWYLKALDKGSPMAMNNIGVMYREAHGVPQDLEVAYALFSRAIETAMDRDDEALGYASRNLDKLMAMITEAQVVRAKKLGKDDLTAAALRQHKPGPEAARQVTALLPLDVLANLPRTYALAPDANAMAYKDTEIEAVHTDGYTDMPEMLGFSEKREEDFSAIVKDGVYVTAPGRYALRVPRLSTGKITVRQAELRQGGEHQVRFFEKGSSPIDAWPLDANPWHAVAVVLQLPPAEWQGKDKEVLDRVQAMQRNFMRELPAEYTSCTVLDGAQGPVVQTVVLNRVPSKLYPQSDARIAPPSRGLTTVGVNRLFFRDCMLVELGLIVARPADLTAEKFPAYAIEQMDLFMSGLVLQPADAPPPAGNRF